MTEAPLTATELAEWRKAAAESDTTHGYVLRRMLATIATLTTRVEQAEAERKALCDAYGIPDSYPILRQQLDANAALTAEAYKRVIGILEARVAELEAALTEQGFFQKTVGGSMVWHVHDCPASFNFAECNYRCRVAREAFALAGTEPYVSEETRRDTEVYE